MSWAGARSPQWIVQHLDARDQVLRRVEFASGDVSVSYLSRLGGSSSITFAESVADDFDWFRDRVSIAYDPGIPGVEAWPVGVYVPTEPTLQRGLRPTVEVSFSPKTAVVDDDDVTDSWSLPRNTMIIDAVVDLLESTGESKITATDSDARTSSDVVFEAGTSKLTVINELLTSAGYGSLWCDGTGHFRVEPYVEPSARPVVRTFEAGETAIHFPDWSREQDLLSVPNRVQVISPGDQDAPPIIGVAENTDPESPYSIPSRGRVISRSEEVSDLSSVAAANAHAARLLAGGMSPVATLDVTHGIVPLDPGDRIRFVSGEERDATVREMNFSLTPDAHCQAKWREL